MTEQYLTLAVGLAPRRQGPLRLQVDNRQAKSFKENTCLTSKIRGVIDMREAWVRELRDEKDIEIVHVPASGQKADILTKGLPNYKFRLGLKLLRGTRHEMHMREIVELAHQR